MKRLDSLNELRAISAITVVLSHIGCTNKLLGGNPGGFAVCIFFLMSGFLTVLSTNRNTDNFLLKRLFKIVPLYYSMTIFCYILGLIKPQLFNTANPTLINLIKSLLFIPYINKNGLSRPLLDVGWYINVLVFFYVIYKVSIIISEKYKVFLCSIFLICSTIIGQVFFPENAIFLLYRNGMVTLTIGMIIGYIYVKRTSRKNENANSQKKMVYNVVMYTFYFCSAVLFSYLKINPYIKLLLPIVLFVVVISFNHIFVPTKILQLISKLSMSIYLTHEFVVKGVSRIIYNLDNISISSMIISLLCLIIVVMVAIPVNYVFENLISKKTIETISGVKKID